MLNKSPSLKCHFDYIPIKNSLKVIINTYVSFVNKNNEVHLQRIHSTTTNILFR